MQDMMYCLNPSSLERQRSHPQQPNTNNFPIDNLFSLQSDHQGLGDAWPSLTSHAINMGEEELVTPTSTTTTISNSTSSTQVGKASSKKRKADRSPAVANDGSKESTSEKKQDYIHVRARRGQATDSHSLAERVRRERISERMKYLQGLVPGCNKITGKAGMLDEIINYVQSLQRQVEFLSMKLAAVNPRSDFSPEALFPKEMDLACNSAMSAVGISSEMADPSLLQFTFLQQAAASCGLGMALAPVAESEPLIDSCYNSQKTIAGWENELNSLYGAAFSFHSLQGNIMPSNLKTEM